MAKPLRLVSNPEPASEKGTKLEVLGALERKVLWLSSWIIHNANHIREARDGLKVGGHQASSASMVTMMTALYFDVLRPQDRVAVKPHASPVFHAIQYLLGNQSLEKIQGFRAFGGVQSYPSRTKDTDDVDISTGSVGLGAAHTVFSSLVQDYVRLKNLSPKNIEEGRMVALVGDAELDEGNIYEALLEGWKKDIHNVWWMIDYNRQSLDSVISDRLFGRIDHLFENMGWRVVMMKYGKMLEQAFAQPGGDALREWIDTCPNSLYSALTFKGGKSWREYLKRDLAGVGGIKAVLDSHDDDMLHRLMTNLAGNDLEFCLEAFNGVTDDAPTCFIGYTVKGFGLPFAGHKDNHAGLMNSEQINELREKMNIPKGHEWEHFSGLDQSREELEQFLADVPFAQQYPRRFKTPQIKVPTLDIQPRSKMSTQEGFGRILNEIGKSSSEFADRIVSTSPDVTVSTNLGPWVNRRGIFSLSETSDTFAQEEVVSAQKWQMTPAGQHIELGIAETNLFLQLSALGLSSSMFGARLLPIGTVYDPFIRRGLDAMHYGCYQDSRYMVVATPSGITLAPEGGAHQSSETPLITLAQPNMAAFEPAYVDELAEIMRWGFEFMQADNGGCVAIRLSTRILEQPSREMTAALRADVTSGAYWLREPAKESSLIIACSGAVMPEAVSAYEDIVEDIPGIGLLAITSADRIHIDWIGARRARMSGQVESIAHIEKMLSPLAKDAALVTICDAHSSMLGWMGSVAGHRIYPLGVDEFGQSGDLPDLYHHYGIDSCAILDAAARACVRRLGG
ncbi:MAG: Pyruvate dehydrogenase E1 component [Alphaproteobacteria bacterium MarineAlpha11_Bin1]|nr:MAG: Pyruvate dehydrogenase E1 component [Alphaproteobacteria bacterium MarineAlpha11_Bin1]|tara:strand:+ start:848 stop:3226 length:2379 start_codon:yes stop_codon:yes gene_type:complete